MEVLFFVSVFSVKKKARSSLENDDREKVLEREDKVWIMNVRECDHEWSRRETQTD